jgi:hypothetical protein
MTRFLARRYDTSKHQFEPKFTLVLILFNKYVTTPSSMSCSRIRQSRRSFLLLIPYLLAISVRFPFVCPILWPAASRLNMSAFGRQPASWLLSTFPSVGCLLLRPVLRPRVHSLPADFHGLYPAGRRPVAFRESDVIYFRPYYPFVLSLFSFSHPVLSWLYICR